MITIMRIAVATPLRHSFDYLVPSEINVDQLKPGIRVRIPFGRKQTIGILLEITQQSNVAKQKLRHVIEILDHEPLIPTPLFNLMVWASQYYQHPIGETLLGILPTLIRQGRTPKVNHECWQITSTGMAQTELKRAKRQQAALALFKNSPEGLTIEQLQQAGINNATLKLLKEKNWITVKPQANKPFAILKTNIDLPTLTQHQQTAINTIINSQGFQTFLLQGITGSGKTEVYLQIITAVLKSGKQALVLVPEIGLTPQTITRFQQRFAAPIAVLHSGLTDQERATAWLVAQQSKAAIIIGTRSAIFTPLANPGIIIIDEEHDSSFKQQSGLRYSARDLAVLRARLENIPVVLGSATPSLESLYNTQQNRYTLLQLPERVGKALIPKFNIIDLRKQYLEDGIAIELINVIKTHLEKGGQVLLFLNRRGYAPALLCHQCGWSAQCSRCDARMTLHHNATRLICHHCGSQQQAPKQCQKCQHTELLALGAGTERLEQVLNKYFPDYQSQRIDRDSTRHKGSMEKILNHIASGQSQILIGTQMLAKGHHFPDVTLVAIIDGDSGIYSADFRASERMAQLIIQVAGRAGRAQRPGEVYIQTHNPQHPLLSQLTQCGYPEFAQTLLTERQLTNWPPFSSITLLRAEAVNAQVPLNFLQAAREIAPTNKHIQLLGPIPAPMERKAGRFRALLLMQTQQRTHLQHWLPTFIKQIETLKLANKVRWSIDVDPTEMY